MKLMINKLFQQKVKGGALQYTIIFSLLILMSLLLFLMFVRLSSLEVYTSQKQSQLIENNNSAIIILENKSRFFENQKQRIQLLEDTTYITDIDISKWGLYDKVKIVSRKGMQQLSKMYLFSDNLKKDFEIPSLYLCGAKKYLSLGGKTYLGNNTFLPDDGIRKSYIGGVGYDRDSLVHGNSFRAGKDLPKIDDKWCERFKNVKKQIDEQFNNTNSLLNRDSIVVSFNEKTLVLRCPSDYYLRDKYVSGNIIISGTKIRIASSSQIHHCIVLADTVIIEKRFVGDIQMFAENYIEIEDSTILQIPTVLYLNNANERDQILVKSHVTIYGEIVIPHLIRSRKEILTVEKGCKLIGQVYCNGYASFEGILMGSLYTTGFMTRSRSGLYENYLVDVCIDSRRLPDEYCGISLIKKANAKICAEEIN